ncbi:MAG: hypothetical protein LBF89_09345 [Bacteroidales bacterium]|nr:hypothetical protein [Bacteroidales bacterium]
MKKYSFLIYYKTYNEFVESIREAGVVHIVEKQKDIPEEAADLRSRLHTADLLKNTLRALEQRLAVRKDLTPMPPSEPVDGMKIPAAYEQLKAQQENLNARRQSLRKEMEMLSVWGNFDWALIAKLKAAGQEMKFYSCRAHDFKAEWKEKFNAMEIAEAGNIVYFITLCPDCLKDEPDAERIRLPEQSLNEVQAALQEAEAQTDGIEQQLDGMTAHINRLKETLQQINGHIDLSKVRLQSEKKAADSLILLEGWVPEAKETELVRVLERQDVWYESREPSKDDTSMPILLKNNRFTRMFEPIGELYDLPNYYELDLTPFFAPFFLLFFGLCLGDAGYGLLLLVAALLLRSKMKPSMRPLLALVACLGAGTVVFGAISGTFFGIPLLEVHWPWFTSFKKIMLNSDQLFSLSLIIGGVQIVFGMTVKAIGQMRRYGWRHSLETWGWLLMIPGAGGLVLMDKQLIPSSEIMSYGCYVAIAIAGIFIFLLNKPGRNPLVNIGAGLWNSYNMATGLLGDLLSYIRLFALGISGSVMGLVFNQLAIRMSGDIPVVSWIVMLIILLIGHSLNIFMSGLGAFVHPMRLTFVEFYKNAGFQGNGKKYRPLKIRTNI